ncbi:MAG: ABC transporter ATP-binding protein [Planctomycetes bacterium]|nr:ABC transporter ATP-binding protein [Planctomycetota bacterium]
MNDSIIKIENLTKYYDGRCVLDNISFEIPQGCIYGLLGRNGTGKTTIIRILLGLEPVTRGSTFIFGKRSDELGANDYGRIGYVAEGHHLIQNYSVSKLTGLCKRLSAKWDDETFDHFIEVFNLPMNRKVKELSTGMRAQLNLALAMATDPQVLILDDPTLGLDTVVRRQFLELAIDVLQRDGRTILFSSHILSDVERIADRIGILVCGQLVVDCELEQLKERVKKMRIIFKDSVPEDLHLTEIINQKQYDHELVITAANWNGHKRAMVETFGPESIDEIPMTLEDIFIECTNPEPVSIVQAGRN